MQRGTQTAGIKQYLTMLVIMLTYSHVCGVLGKIAANVRQKARGKKIIGCDEGRAGENA